jgi:hypothetical protein
MNDGASEHRKTIRTNLRRRASAKQLGRFVEDSRTTACAALLVGTLAFLSACRSSDALEFAAAFAGMVLPAAYLVALWLARRYSRRAVVAAGQQAERDRAERVAVRQRFQAPQPDRTASELGEAVVREAQVR